MAFSKVAPLHLLLILVTLFLSYQLISAWTLRMAYEAHGPFTWDTTIYWAMGRGILNGLIPYRDLFESKPPGIFLLSALSLLLTDDVWLCSVFQIITLSMIALIPAVFLVVSTDSLKKFRNKNLLVIAVIAVFFGIIISLYSAERAGEIQVESFGAAFISAYALVIFLQDPTRWGVKSGYFWLAVLSLLLGIGSKEPFVLTAMCVAILCSNSVNQFCRNFIIPLMMAAIVGILYLYGTGMLEPYFIDYLGFMTKHRIQGSPWACGLLFLNQYRDLNNFCMFLGVAVVALLIYFMKSEINNRKSGSNIFELLVIIPRLFIIIYLPMLAVGLGGEFFNHHFVFQVPFFIALVLYYLKRQNKNYPCQTSGFTLIFFVLLSLSILNLPHFDYQIRLKEIKDQEIIVKTEAHYIDSILDASNKERYLFIGANGVQPYAFTKHSPLGKYFFQYPWMFASGKNDVRDDFISSLRDSEVIVFDRFQINDLNEYTERYIQLNYSITPWDVVSGIERKARRYTIYFRKS